MDRLQQNEMQEIAGEIDYIYILTVITKTYV